MRIRLPPELKEQIEATAKDNGRSMNAEIVHRLEASFVGTVVPESLPNAMEAKKLAEHARFALKENVRSYISEQIYNAIQRGAHSAYINFAEFIALDDINDEMTDPLSVDVIDALLGELNKAGYETTHTDVLHYLVEF